MRILEVVTVPFFTPRGTAFSALERTRVLCELGHRVDLLTYGMGADVELPGLRIFRVPGLGIRSLRMGPSAAKLLLDGLLAARTAWHLLVRGPYDLVHVHEESAFWVAALRRLHRGRVLHDMHSSLAEQLANFGYRRGAFLRGLFARAERWALARADAVIVICPELLDTVRRASPAVPAVLIENLPVGWELPRPDPAAVARLREELGTAGARAVLYTGSFGENQGLESAIDALGIARKARPDLVLVLLGGVGADLERVRAHAEARGLLEHVVLAGPRPHTEMPLFMEAADVLVSPRLRGTNTPLKIYSYLASGKPILATDLRTHTQVLSPEVAHLVPPAAEALAAGLLALVNEPAYAARLGAAARRLAQERYGIERYRREVAGVLTRLGAPA